MHLSKYKKINTFIFSFSVAVLLILNFFWTETCTFIGCDFYLRNAILRPLYQLSLGLSGISLLLLFFPAHYFRGWLIYIASWGFPLSYILVAAVDPGSSSVLSISRTQATQILVVIFGGITVLYVVWHYYKQRQLSVVTENDSQLNN